MAGKSAKTATVNRSAAKGAAAKPQTISYKMATVTAPSLRGKLYTGDWADSPVDELPDKERLQFKHLEQFLPEPVQEGTHSLLIRTDGRGSCRVIYGPKLVNHSDAIVLQFGSALYPVTQEETFLYLGELKGTLQVEP